MPDKNKIIFGTNNDTYIGADEAGNIILQHEEGQRVALTGSAIEPATDETLDLGTATNKFKDLYLSSDSIYIGNTKLSSDPTTGALSTVVGDAQGQFTAPAAPVGGSSKPYAWKGTTTNYAYNSTAPLNTSGNFSKCSMEYLYNFWVNTGFAERYNTGPIEVIWGNYLGNPNTTQETYWGSVPLSSGNYNMGSAFITDENGDDLSAFLVNYMDENNVPIVNFDFSMTAKLEVKDPVKAAQIPFFQAGQFNNLTNVTSVPLWSMTQDYMYAFKTAATNLNGHTRGIMMGVMQNQEPDYFGGGGYAYNLDGNIRQNGSDFRGLYFLGENYYQFNQMNVFMSYSGFEYFSRVGSNLSIRMDMDLNNPYTNLQSTDPNAGNPSYFDLQDGIVFEMLVNIR
jgi:hypothetical protein